MKVEDFSDENDSAFNLADAPNSDSEDFIEDNHVYYGEPKLEIVPTYRNGVKAHIDGFCFFKGREDDNKAFWVCKERKVLRCAAGATTQKTFGIHTIVRINNIHNHGSNVERKKRLDKEDNLNVTVDEPTIKTAEQDLERPQPVSPPKPVVITHHKKDPLQNHQLKCRFCMKCITSSRNSLPITEKIKNDFVSLTHFEVNTFNS